MMNWAPSAEQHTGAGQPLCVNVASKEELLTDLQRLMRDQTGFTVATLNLDHVVKLRRHPAFRAAYQRHSHVTADGNPIVWLSRLAGQNLHLAPGSELIEPLVARAADLGVRVAFLGATRTSLDEAARVLEAHYSGLQVVARIAPEMGFEPDSASAQSYIDALAQSGAGLCFLALGAPKQELFAIRIADNLPHMGVLSIGAGLDFISGTQTRAPRLARALAAEWLWRMFTNPTRLARRYGACLAILPGLTLRALRSGPKATDQRKGA